MRRTALLVATALALLTFPQAGEEQARAEGFCTAQAGWGEVRPEWVVRLNRLTNAHRESKGLSTLSISRSLTRAALWKAQHMARYGYLAHDDPAPPVRRSWDQRIQDCGYSGPPGENVASGYPNPKSALHAWLSSPGHRENIQEESYRVIGVGAATAADGTPYWVQVFGTEDDSAGDAHNPPRTLDDSISLVEDTAQRVKVLKNDDDPDGDPIGVETVTQPGFGSTYVDESYAVKYAPERNFYGPDTFTYTAMDVFGRRSTASVDVTVEPVNDSPVAAGERLRVRAGKRVTADVLLNDRDADKDPLRVKGIAARPRHGSAVVDKGRYITYRASAGGAGERDRVRYKIADGNGGFDTARLRIQIRAAR